MPETRTITEEDAARLTKSLVGLSLPISIEWRDEPQVRSVRSHNHQFAEIYELFSTLPESFANAPYAKSKEAFRKHGLIVKGFCDIETEVFESQEHAVAAAPVVARMARRDHGYALVNVKGNVLTCATPHSQTFKAMGKQKFQESKQAVLDWAHEILGVIP